MTLERLYLTGLTGLAERDILLGETRGDRETITKEETRWT